MTNKQSYAQNELNILSKSFTDPHDRPLVEPFIPEILSLCKKFGKVIGSETEAILTATAISRALKRILMHEPLMPITGIDEEWFEAADEVWQNNRCGEIFKAGKNGRPYYLNAVVWKNQEGDGHYGSAFLEHLSGKIAYNSRQYIKSFPFTPKTFYIDVIETEIAKDDWESVIKNPNQLIKVFKYYDCYIAPSSNSTNKKCLYDR